MMVGKVIKDKFQSYTKPCKRCGNIFNPTSKYNKICDPCDQRARQWRDKK